MLASGTKHKVLLFGRYSIPRALLCVLTLVPGAQAGPQQPNIDSDGLTPLMRALRDGERQEAVALLGKAPDLNAFDVYGWTALTYACANGDVGMVKALLSKGSGVNGKQGADHSPLGAAIQFHNVNVVRLLIESGADVNLPDDYGVTPLTLALHEHQSKTVDLLRKAGAVESARKPGDRLASFDTKAVAQTLGEPLRYTETARYKRVQGVVSGRLLVGTTGKVEKVHVMKGLPYGLTYQAINSLMTMAFKPATRDGAPVPFWAPITLEFQLR